MSAVEWATQVKRSGKREWEICGVGPTEGAARGLEDARSDAHAWARDLPDADVRIVWRHCSDWIESDELSELTGGVQ